MSPEQGNIPTSGEKAALAGGSTFGTPSSTNKYITQDYNSSATGLPVVRDYGKMWGDQTTRFDVTLTGGTTYRYTYDGTGTDPGISAVTAPVGYKVNIFSPNFATLANNGSFTITASGSNYFEVTNASGAAEANIVMGSAGNPGYLQIYNPTWTKPAGLKYIAVEVAGGGGGGGGNTTFFNGAGGGGGGGYSKEIIPAASLGATETVTVGNGGAAGLGAGGTGGTGGTSTFGTSPFLTATGGVGGVTDSGSGGTGGNGGVGSGGDTNLLGGSGGAGIGVTGMSISGAGGSSILGIGSGARTNEGTGSYGAAGYLAGGGGSGACNENSSGDFAGGQGAAGTVIVTEYYS